MNNVRLKLSPPWITFVNEITALFDGDLHGVVSTLYEDLARDIFADAGLCGVVFNTVIEHKVGMPLGEWP